MQLILMEYTKYIIRLGRHERMILAGIDGLRFARA
jgi:hypothetical protein